MATKKQWTPQIKDIVFDADGNVGKVTGLGKLSCWLNIDYGDGITREVLDRTLKPCPYTEAELSYIRRAAPDLFEACKFVLEALESAGESKNYNAPLLRAAIKKATKGK